MLHASYTKYTLRFKQPVITSRGIMTEKETFFVKVWDHDPQVFGIGECPLFRGLSADDRPDFEEKLHYFCQNIKKTWFTEYNPWPTIHFGLECAVTNLSREGRSTYYPTSFTEGRSAIDINGLIWMGDKETMSQRIKEKIKAGYRCLKLKIGAINFEDELDLLRCIRQQFSKEELELRLDANGAFTPQEAPFKLDELARYDIHSIEQPIRQGQLDEMAKLCRNTPVPIALDEELIGPLNVTKKIELLKTVRPQYVVLKPSLIGSFSDTFEWLSAAEENGIGWWITSALESNIGLAAIAQFTAYISESNTPCQPQGLGTGQLYSNNIPSPLVQKGTKLWYNPSGTWDISQLKF